MLAPASWSRQFPGKAGPCIQGTPSNGRCCLLHRGPVCSVVNLWLAVKLSWQWARLPAGQPRLEGKATPSKDDMLRPALSVSQLPHQAGLCCQGYSQQGAILHPAFAPDMSLVKLGFVGRAAPCMVSCCLLSHGPHGSLFKLGLEGKLLPGSGHAASYLVDQAVPWSGWALQAMCFQQGGHDASISVGLVA